MILELDDLSRQYGDERAVDGVSFGLEPGELVGLLGPSGCGKTTIVQMIAGHVRPTSGQVLLRGADVTDDPPESRRIGLVFQESTLYPHMTVFENVAYGVAAREDDPAEREAVVTESLDLVGLEAQRDAYPSKLSGGQRRRVELARAIAPEPDLLVLDEPLSALDRNLRDRLRDEIGRIQEETGVTTLFVTHDQADAMALADRLVVLSEGSLSAMGTPRELYESPPTPFVASFLGRSTTLTARLVGTDPPRVAVGDTEITLESARTDCQPGRTVTCHVRPRDLTLRSAADAEIRSAADAGLRSAADAGMRSAADAGERLPPDAGSPRSLCGEVTAIEDRGRRYDVRVRIAAGEELVVERTDAPPAIGESVAVELPTAGVTLFDSDPDEA